MRDRPSGGEGTLRFSDSGSHIQWSLVADDGGIDRQRRAAIDMPARGEGRLRPTWVHGAVEVTMKPVAYFRAQPRSRPLLAGR